MAIMENLNEEFVSQLRAKYDTRFNAIAKVDTSFNDEKAIKLGILLENTEEAFSRASRLFESTQTSSVADGLKNMYFDIITASFPGLIAEDLFSVQPLRQKMGQIFFLKYLYGSTKGGTAAGTEMFAPNAIAGYENRNYTSEIVEDELLFETDGTERSFDGNISYIPVLPGTVKLTVGGVAITDNGANVLAGTGVTGTINYATGAYTLTWSVAPAAADVYADYEYDLGYAPSTIPQIDIKISDTIVQARPRKLRGIYSLDAGYDLKMAQGIDIRDTLLEAAAAQLKHEIDGDLISDVMAQAATTVTWNSNYNNQTQEVSRYDFYQDFLDTLVKASSVVRQKTKRVEANWLVCGKKAMDILNVIGAPKFVSAGNTNAVGPHFAGTLNNQWKVYVNPFLGENEFLFGYKGDTLVDAGMVYAPYLPFFATETVMLDDFAGRRGFASSYGKKMINPNLYVKGIIS